MLKVVIIMLLLSMVAGYIYGTHQRKEKERAAAEEALRKKQQLEDIRRKNEEERLQREERSKAAKAEAGEKFNKLLASIPAYEITKDPGAKRTNKKDCERADISMSNITKSSDVNKLSNFIAIDTETTGLSARQNQIVELTAIKFEAWEPIEIFTTLINPGVPIPEEASSIHGITDEMVQDAPKIAEVIKSFDEFIGKKNLVGHNLPFDLGFLDYAGSEYSSVKRKYYDTLYLAKLLDLSTSDNKLTTLCDHYYIRDNSTAHRSASDALAAGILFQKLVDLKTS